MNTKDPKIQELENTIYKYKRTVYGIALTMLDNKNEADDVFQEVFLLYFSKDLTFDIEEKKKAWLIRTAVNKCRQYNSTKWNTNIDKSSELDVTAVVDLETAEDKKIFAAIKELPPEHRENIYLHYFLGLSVNEMASIFGVKANTVSTRLSKAKKLLHDRLEEDYL